jgi:predicted RNA-binding protein YlxR (DUF448 family)
MEIALTLASPERATHVPAFRSRPADPLRTCIVTGEQTTPQRMIRFVVGPGDEIVPDLGRRLPGRGMWLRAERAVVERAVAKKAFAKAARRPVRVAADLPERVERLLLERALADLGRARRAGRAVAGFVKAKEMVGKGMAGLLVLADEADGDGADKLAASGLPLVRLGDAAALGGIFGRERTVYAAVARDDAAGEFVDRLAAGAARWRDYRSNSTG